jgi:hypothetical protein
MMRGEKISLSLKIGEFCLNQKTCSYRVVFAQCFGAAHMKIRGKSLPCDRPDMNLAM